MLHSKDRTLGGVLFSFRLDSDPSNAETSALLSTGSLTASLVRRGGVFKEFEFARQNAADTFAPIVVIGGKLSATLLIHVDVPLWKVCPVP